MKISNLPNELIVEIFSYVGNPQVLQEIDSVMKKIVEEHFNLLYRPIYRKIHLIEGVDLVTFERERGIDAALSMDLKVKKAWRVLNLYRKHVRLPPVLFHRKADNMLQRYQKGHLELQSALVTSRVTFWIALGGAGALDQYTPLELGRELRRWMHEHCDPNSKVLILFQNFHPSIPPEIAFFRSIEVIQLRGMWSQEIIEQLRTLKRQGWIPWATRLERIEYEAMKMIHNFNL